MVYTRKPLGTIIHATVLIISVIELVYSSNRIHKEIEYLSTKEPSDSGPITELAIVFLILVILVRTFFAIVSFLYLVTPNLIMSMYKSEGRFILFIIHAIIVAPILWHVAAFMIKVRALDMFFVLITIDMTSLFAASVSMWSGVDSPLFPWKTSSTKSGELAGQIV